MTVRTAAGLRGSGSWVDFEPNFLGRLFGLTHKDVGGVGPLSGEIVKRFD